jgi:hypothetical protein
MTGAAVARERISPRPRFEAIAQGKRGKSPQNAKSGIWANGVRQNRPNERMFGLRRWPLETFPLTSSRNRLIMLEMDEIDSHFCFFPTISEFHRKSPRSQALRLKLPMVPTPLLPGEKQFRRTLGFDYLSRLRRQRYISAVRHGGRYSRVWILR